jgi:SAM-dependent methyltransferase
VFSRRDSIQPFLDKIDSERLRDIQKRCAGSNDRYAKYADVERWLKINLARVRELKLDRSAPKQILDLGCGAGFFLFLAKQFGHHGIGVDVDLYPVSNELIDLFEVKRVIHQIRAFQPLPDFGKTFDLITAFSSAFGRSEDESGRWREPTLRQEMPSEASASREAGQRDWESRGWTSEEWKFFLDDLDRHRAPGGGILIEVNSGKDGRYFPAEVRDFFLARGAKIEGERVWL